MSIHFIFSFGRPTRADMWQNIQIKGQGQCSHRHQSNPDLTMRKGLEVALIALMSEILLTGASRASLGASFGVIKDDFKSHEVIRQVHPCKGLLERAQEEVAKDIFQLTIKGATSPKFSRKKVTSL